MCVNYKITSGSSWQKPVYDRKLLQTNMKSLVQAKVIYTILNLPDPTGVLVRTH